MEYQTASLNTILMNRFFFTLIEGRLSFSNVHIYIENMFQTNLLEFFPPRVSTHCTWLGERIIIKMQQHKNRPLYIYYNSLAALQKQQTDKFCFMLKKEEMQIC